MVELTDITSTLLAQPTVQESSVKINEVLVRIVDQNEDN